MMRLKPKSKQARQTVGNARRQDPGNEVKNNSKKVKRKEREWGIQRQ